MTFMYHILVLIHDVFKHELENTNYAIIFKMKLMLITLLCRFILQTIRDWRVMQVKSLQYLVFLCAKANSKLAISCYLTEILNNFVFFIPMWNGDDERRCFESTLVALKFHLIMTWQCRTTKQPTVVLQKGTFINYADFFEPIFVFSNFL